MAKSEECSACEYADIIERAAAKFRTACRGCPPTPISELRERFDAEVRKELERRVRANTEGASHRAGRM